MNGRPNPLRRLLVAVATFTTVAVFFLLTLTGCKEQPTPPVCDPVHQPDNPKDDGQTPPADGDGVPTPPPDHPVGDPVPNPPICDPVHQPPPQEPESR